MYDFVFVYEFSPAIFYPHTKLFICWLSCSELKENMWIKALRSSKSLGSCWGLVSHSEIQKCGLSAESSLHKNKNNCLWWPLEICVIYNLQLLTNYGHHANPNISRFYLFNHSGTFLQCHIVAHCCKPFARLLDVDQSHLQPLVLQWVMAWTVLKSSCCWCAQLCEERKWKDQPWPFVEAAPAPSQCLGNLTLSVTFTVCGSVYPLYANEWKSTVERVYIK